VQALTFNISALEKDGNGVTRSDLDNHAECIVLGKHCLVLHDYDRPIEVRGYDPNGPPYTAKTVSAAVAYQDSVTGDIVILVFHQALLIPHLEHNLISPMQMREHGVIVNCTPKFQDPNPSDDSHCIIVEDCERQDKLRIPLSIHRVISYFPTFKPTPHQYESCDRVFHMTAEEPEWDPTNPIFAEQEAALVDDQGCLVNTQGDRGRTSRVLAGVSSSQPSTAFIAAVRQDPMLNDCVSPTMNEHLFLESLKQSVNISSTQLANQETVNQLEVTQRHKGVLRSEDLARNFGISMDAAQRTLKVTTQRGIRTVLHPCISRRFRTNDRQLRYRRLPEDLYTDTFKSKEKSTRGNEHAQIYVAKNGWARVFPMKHERDAPETLPVLFKRDGVPPAMIMDNANAQIKGLFRKRLADAGCYLKRTEPYSPWQNAAESGI
jgi:hypothetical protein